MSAAHLDALANENVAYVRVLTDAIQKATGQPGTP